MKPPIFAQLHADLAVIAATAIVIQAAVFISIEWLRVPQHDFATPGFRYGVIAVVALMVLVARWFERRAAMDTIDAMDSRPRW
ncbi:hypothetical protein B0G62_11882 [Paraburkholderia eburnea]|uniref:Uncharacterized protein n=1 Tax=Paraburkholderia eburnea TaxID=1189126 RepID=A0A2S4LYF6_9BURK|nr:hypothetical protein [Paraburkholderia eburnea]POR47491.1 hypothetical protein B0G62_11882 [Paraburkholderia eburnea]PRZ19079.1 hypothetical protein BX588_11882 [Paraburkholderia eburnea]